MNNIYDVGIIGTGVAGAFACLKLAKDYKGLRIVAFDLGRPPQKRKRQIDGYLGCLPSSDGKLYQNDLLKVSELVTPRKVKSAHTYVKNILSQVNDFKLIKDKSPSINMSKKIKKIGYDISLNDYVQMYPKDIHMLSKYMSDTIELSKNITFNFDNEVVNVIKQKNTFIISSENGEYRCKKLVIAVGRSGWRWAAALYEKFGIIENNDIAKFGIRVEVNSGAMKDFNKSNCTLSKEGLELGPMSWYGTVIPEDHLDLAISAFRSNENRWKTDKVSFNLIGNRAFFNKGFEQTDRLGKLTFVLANDRIIKERVSAIMNGKSKISILTEYDWLKPVISELSLIIPEITIKAYFHVPTIIPMTPKINIGSNLETAVDGMYVVGESAGVNGILSAALTGTIVADMVAK